MVKGHGWYPYEFQSGYVDDMNVELFNSYVRIRSTTVAVAGEDYVVVASDTRLTENHAIQSRTHSNIYKMSDTTRIVDGVSTTIPIDFLGTTIRCFCQLVFSAMC